MLAIPLSHLMPALALLAMSAGLQGQTLDWGMEIPASTAATSFQRPRIVVNDAGAPVVLWGRPSPGAMHAAVLDGGVFSGPVMLNPMGLEAWSVNWAGGDLAAAGNEMAAVYSTGSLGVGALYCVRSQDGGFTWGDTVRVAPVPPLEARFCTVAIVPGLGPAVQYMEFDSGWANARYVSARSLDGGLTFEPPAQVSAPHSPGDVCDCCTGQNVADADHVVSLFRNNGPDIRTIWGAVSTDNGASFPIGGELDGTNWNISACPSSGPDAYLSGDSIRYVWMSGAMNGTKIYMASAALSDLAATTSLPVHGGQPMALQQNYPRIAGSGDTLGIVWQQSAGGQYEVLFRWSVSGFAGLSEPDTVSTSIAGMQRNPDVTYRNGVFHLVWEDHPSGSVRYRTATITDDTGIAVPADQEPVLAWPSPVSDLLHVDVHGLSVERIQLLDPLGRIVLERSFSSLIDVSTLAPGSYLLVAGDVHGNVLATSMIVVAR